MTGGIQNFQIFFRRTKKTISFPERMSRVWNFADASGMRIYRAPVSLNKPRITGSMVSVFVRIQKKV